MTSHRCAYPLVAALVALCLAGAAHGQEWQYKGLVDQHPRQIAVSVIDHTIFVSGEFAGVHVSQDGGLRWTSTCLLPDAPVIELPMLDALALAPALNSSSSHTLFVAGMGSINVARSEDGGASWINTAINPSDDKIWSLAVSPSFSDDHTVFAAGTSGVLKSINGGVSFASASSGLTAGSAMVYTSPAFNSDHTLLASVSSHGVFRSTDGGDSWQSTSRTTGGDGLIFGGIVFSPDFASSSEVFFSDSYSGLFHSNDAGITWQLLPSASGTVYPASISLSPNFDHDRTMAGMILDQLWMSYDAGQSWQTVGQQVGAGLWDTAFSPEFATDGVIYGVGPGAGVWSIPVPEPASTAILTLLIIPLLRRRRSA